MAETWGNRYLSAFGEEMTGNAQIILDTMTSIYGWTKESVCGMLGNMQVESTINSGIYQSLNTTNPDLGFGLVQWTPKAKYISWAQGLGFNSYDEFGRIAPQTQRLNYEVENSLQWIATYQYPISFREFTQSQLSPNLLADVFIKNYERPRDQDQPIRGQYAMYWYENLEGGGVIPPNPSDKTTSIYPCGISNIVY